MKMLVFIGPSGGGKSTLIRVLQARGVVAVTPSWTTRPRRSDESEDDTDHRFLTDAEFTVLQNAGFFLEVVEMFGFRYGLPAPEPSDDAVPVISVRAPLLGLVDEHFPNHVVYQVEASLDVARERMRARGDSRVEQDARLAAYAEEVARGRQLCDRVFDTSGPVRDVADAVASAIAEDFNIDHDAAPRMERITDTRGSG